MEALGAATSIIAVIETTAAVFQTCLQYSLAVKDAKKEIKSLQEEAADVQKLLVQLADLAAEPKAKELPALSEVLAPGGPLQTCGVVMKELLDQLNVGKGAEMKRFGLRALKWPFKSEDVDKTLVVLERCKSSFNLALATDQMKLALITNNETQEYRKGQYKEKIVQWLASVEAGINWNNHEDARKKYEPETGMWLLEGSETYQAWKQTAGNLLWIWGSPGCGKTIMVSSIIEDLRDLTEKDDTSALAYFYFDFGTPAKQNVLNCARYILSRIVALRQDEVPQDLKQLYTKKCNYGHEDPTLSDLTDMLELLSSEDRFNNIYLVIDGLDEAPLKDGKRDELLTWLVHLNGRLQSKLHLCASSRREVDIEEKFAELEGMSEICMEESKVGGDIRLYIQRSLTNHAKLKRLPPALKSEIQETLFRKAEGMFRWVDCQLNDLKRCKTKPQITEALKHLPSSLPATYERILEAIPDEDVEYARRALWWLVMAQRPLTIEELAEAAVIDLENEPSFDPDYRFFDAREQLLEILGSLVSVTRTQPGSFMGDAPDPFTPASAIQAVETVRLSHNSVQEYLLSERLRKSTSPKLKNFGADTGEMSAYLSNSSLQYLHCYIESETRQGSLEDTAELPLLCYVAQRWSTHFSASANSAKDSTLAPLALRLLQEQSPREVWLSVYAPNQPRKPLFTGPDELGQPLHYAALLGLDDVIKLMADEDVNCVTESGITPLHYACNFKQVSVVKPLLERGASVNAQTRGGRGPMHEAAKKGSLSAVHLLARAGAEIDLPDCDGWTPFYYACESNHIVVAKYLLQDASDPQVAKLLREELEPPFNTPRSEIPKANAGSRTNSGGSPLHQVSGWGYVGVVKLLLEHGAEVNIATGYGRTPLHQAAGGGALEVVKMLLQAGADPHATDLSGYSVRDLAEDNGYMDIADVLIAAEAKTPQKPMGDADADGHASLE